MNIKNLQPTDLGRYLHSLGTRLEVDTKNIVNALTQAEIHENTRSFNKIKSELLYIFPTISNTSVYSSKVVYKGVMFVGNYSSCMYETFMPEFLRPEADEYIRRKQILDNDTQILRQKIYQYINQDADAKLRRYFPDIVLEKMKTPNEWVRYMKTITPDTTYQLDTELEELVAYYLAKLLLWKQ